MEATELFSFKVKGSVTYVDVNVQYTCPVIMQLTGQYITASATALATKVLQTYKGQ